METTSWIDVRPAAGLVRRYRALGFWRDATPAADVRRWAAETPHAIAVTAHRAGAGVVRMSYREYAGQVDRMAAVLADWVPESLSRLSAVDLLSTGMGNPRHEARFSQSK